MSAGRPRRRDELAALLTDLPRRLAEQQLGTELKSNFHRPRGRPRGLQCEFSIAAIEPARLPAVGLVRQVVLGARAPISIVTRPREGLIETLALQLDGARREDEASLELGQSRHHRVVGDQRRAPRRGIDATLSEHLPLAERHLRQHDDVRRVRAQVADQVRPRALSARGLVGELAHRDLQRAHYRLDPPRIPPSTPRRIWRPIWLPTVRAACLAMASTMPWRRFVPQRMSLTCVPRSDVSFGPV